MAQLIEFNTTFIASAKTLTTSNYHYTSQESPLPIYLGALIHSITRIKTLINKL